MPTVSFSQLRSAGVRFGAPLVVAALMLVSLESILAAFAQYQDLLLALPYVLLGFVILLGQPFNQSKTALTALMMMITFYIIQTYLQSPLSEPQTRLIYLLLATLLPLNLLQVHILPERRLFSRFGTGYLLFLCAQLGWGALVVSHFAEQPLPQLWERYFYTLKSLSPLPLLLLLLYLGTCLACGSAVLKRNLSHDQSVFTCLLFAGITFATFQQSYISAVAFSVTGLILLLNLISCSHELAYIDPLTGIPGRRALETELKHLGRNYTLAMVDVDHFKAFNDTYGHKTGDDVLRLVARKMLKIKGGAEVYRYGGEEFTVLFKGKDKQACLPYLETLRETIADYEMALRQHDSRSHDDQGGTRERENKTNQDTVQVTVSIGVADSFPDTHPTAVMKAADEALYQAKKAGRNQICS